MKFVILSTSRGTTMQAVLDAVSDRSLTMQCLGLISDSEEHGCVEKARNEGIPVHIIAQEKDMEREMRDKALHEAITTLGGDPSDTVIAALGWMFIFSPWFIETWTNRIINVHPALLPKYGGKGMYGMKVHETVLASGDSETGMTIPIMDEGVDTGPILLQKKCTIVDSETPESLKAKVQGLEKQWYPELLQMIESGAVTL